MLMGESSRCDRRRDVPASVRTMMHLRVGYQAYPTRALHHQGVLTLTPILPPTLPTIL